MSLDTIGQRCVSEREPELGLGVVATVDRTRIGIRFPAAGEQRLYTVGTPVLKRVQFRTGETIRTREGKSLVIEHVEEEGSLLVYVGNGRRVREDEISDVTSVGSPQERLMSGQVDPCDVFDLRARALRTRARVLQSDVRGFLGGRLELIPHQFYILHEVSSREIPRVLLADEVGLGKTIEACLILQRLLTIGRAQRVLILVPETLVHQWFVELLRRFSLWFTILDEERCAELARADAGGNPFFGSQRVLCSLGWLEGRESLRAQAVEAGWDMVVVDEAHHLKWSPDAPSTGYTLVEQLARRAPGLLLLTATPTQLGLEGHFARLRLLDPDRFSSFERFQEEAAQYAQIAGVADSLLQGKKLLPEHRANLQALFRRDPGTLEQRLAALDQGQAGAAAALLRTLLDQHGPGRVVFRNTRAAMSGFPPRQFSPVPLRTENAALLARATREREAEEAGDITGLRYSFKGDPRIEWLATFLRDNRETKVLLICRSQRKVLAVEAALRELTAAKVGLFHEGLALVQRDRNAAWFTEPDGAQLLICSEIGSEGRNFQFAHDLVLFDLPLNAGLIEQRIGRLDRIGQKGTIRIHVPYLTGSGDEVIVDWYHRGLNAFEAPLHGGPEYDEAFRSRLLVLASEFADGDADRTDVDTFIRETEGFRYALEERLRRGRDRLLELHSYDAGIAERVITKIREAEKDSAVRTLLLDVLDHFGVRVKEHEQGDLFLDPAHAYVESFPSIPAEGMLATFQRIRAIAREDIRFLSADHPLFADAVGLLVDSPAGTSAFGLIQSGKPNLLLEALFVVEAVADSRWNVSQFIAPTPVRVLVDLRGRNLGAERDPILISQAVQDGSIQRFLEQPGFNAAVLKRMVQAASEIAESECVALKADARARAQVALGDEVQRLVELQRLNDAVRPEEIVLARERMQRTLEAVADARVRLDSLRLIVEGPASTVLTRA